MTPEQLATINECIDNEISYWTNISTSPEDECKREAAAAQDARAALKKLFDAQVKP